MGSHICKCKWIAEDQKANSPICHIGISSKVYTIYANVLGAGGGLKRRQKAT